MESTETKNTAKAAEFSLARAWATIIVIVLAGFFLARFSSKVYSDQATSTNEKVARLHLARSAVDLGNLPSHESHTVTFRMMNRGNSRLVISQIARECCGEPVQKTMIIRPGSSIDWVASIDTGGELGNVESLTSFTTNDPTQPRFDLLLKAHVDPAMQ